MKKSLISAIKKLLAKLGAKEVEGNNLVEVIDSGAEAIEGGGGSGGSNDFYFKITENQYNDLLPTYGCDKTFAEIEEAYVSGKILHCIISVKMEGSEVTRVYDPIIALYGDSAIRINFVDFDPPIDSDPIIHCRCYLLDTNGIKKYFKSL